MAVVLQGILHPTDKNTVAIFGIGSSKNVYLEIWREDDVLIASEIFRNARIQGGTDFVLTRLISAGFFTTRDVRWARYWLRHLAPEEIKIDGSRKAAVVIDAIDTQYSLLRSMSTPEFARRNSLNIFS